MPVPRRSRRYHSQSMYQKADSQIQSTRCCKENEEESENHGSVYSPVANPTTASFILDSLVPAEQKLPTMMSAPSLLVIVSPRSSSQLLQASPPASGPGQPLLLGWSSGCRRSSQSTQTQCKTHSTSPRSRPNQALTLLQPSTSLPFLAAAMRPHHRAVPPSLCLPSLDVSHGPSASWACRG